jgi:hypothetical protein
MLGWHLWLASLIWTKVMLPEAVPRPEKSAWHRIALTAQAGMDAGCKKLGYCTTGGFCSMLVYAYGGKT